MAQYDFIVVGAGSAGCVLAHGLCDGGRNRVLVLECGPTDRHPYVKIPLGYGLLFKDRKRNFRYATMPEPGLMGRRLYCPRGRVVGGSGSINALVWCRGMPSDYDGWRIPGWGWPDVQPVFDALETRAPGMAIADPVALRHPFTRHFAAAAAELGYPADADFNGPAPEGAGFYRITARDGRRFSSADAFLRPALATGSVRLLTSARVCRVLFEGARATGVIYQRYGARTRATARRAVVMAAGAVHTPQILQLSGVGDGALLRRFGIPVRRHNPNVGRHLQDHLAVGYHYRAHGATLNGQLHSLTAKTKHLLGYLTTRGGPLASSVNQYGGFLRSSDDLRAPDQQLYLNPASYTVSRGRNGLVIQPDPFEGFTLSFQPTRPESRGAIEIVSPDIAAAPAISLGALSAPCDLRGVIAGARLIARLATTDALRKVTRAPVSNCPAHMTDAEIIDDFRARAGSVFHPCGSCAMGTGPDRSVVGPTLAVHGLDGLFVADASVFPAIPSGNINAPTLMIARKGAARILAATSPCR